jgi:hypothetical protein
MKLFDAWRGVTLDCRWIREPRPLLRKLLQTTGRKVIPYTLGLGRFVAVCHREYDWLNNCEGDAQGNLVGGIDATSILKEEVQQIRACRDN